MKQFGILLGLDGLGQWSPADQIVGSALGKAAWRRQSAQGSLFCRFRCATVPQCAAYGDQARRAWTGVSWPIKTLSPLLGSSFAFVWLPTRTPMKTKCSRVCLPRRVLQKQYFPHEPGWATRGCEPVAVLHVFGGKWVAGFINNHGGDRKMAQTMEAIALAYPGKINPLAATPVPRGP